MDTKAPLRLGLVLVFALTVAAPGLVAAASTTNWGAGVTNEKWRCLNSGEKNEEQSECTSDDDHWYVYIDSNIPTALRPALEASITYDYGTGHVPQFTATLQATLDSNTDARVRIANIRNSFDYSIYTTCAAGTTEGGGSGYYRYCKRQIIKYDPDHHHAPSVRAKPDFFACHELGHTTGLQHALPKHNNPRPTCMSYDGNVNLDVIDEQQLTDCYPRPSPAPSDLTTACREYQPPACPRLADLPFGTLAQDERLPSPAPRYPCEYPR
jgi:hypothetical protein